MYTAWEHAACLVLLAVGSFAFGAENLCESDRPAQEIVVKRPGGKASEAGHVDGRIWITYVVPFPPKHMGDHVEADNPLDVWRWEEAALKKDYELRSLGACTWFQWLSEDRYIAKCESFDGSAWPIILRDARSKQEIRKWGKTTGWDDWALKSSQNGKYVALLAGQSRDVVGYDWERPKCRVGLVDVGGKKLSWITALDGKDTASRVIPSNDGTRIGVIPLDGPVGRRFAMIDVPRGRVLWSIPTEDGSVGHRACFSRDGKVLFVGCEGPVIRSFNVESGEKKAKWNAAATGSNQSVGSPGYVTDLDVSADGEFLAATTNCPGETYVWSVKTAKMRRLCYADDQWPYLATFSPDSEQLATADDNRIRIWARRMWSGQGPGVAAEEPLPHARPTTASPKN